MTVLVVRGVPVQALSLGPCRLQVIVPLGPLPPVSVATSLIGVPTGAEAGVALVVRPGVSLVIVTFSLGSVQPTGPTAALLTSPR